MLSPQAWNAFLKTLEEPPPRTIFVLATTEAQKVLPTVVDRCHRFDFGRPSAQQIATVVERVARSEAIDVDEHALGLVARHATGSFRDALGTLEQLVAYRGNERIEPADVLAVLGVADDELLFGAVKAAVEHDPAQALRIAGQLAESGRDPGQVLRDLERYARELLAVKILGEVPLELRVTPERDRRLGDQARIVSRTDAVRLLDLIAAALEATANGAQPRIQLELVLIKAAVPEVDPTTSALLARIERLEGREGREGGTEAIRPQSPPQAETEPPDHTPTPPADAVELWPAVVEHVKEHNALLAHALADARPIDASERELVLAIGSEFNKRKAEQDEHRRMVADAVKALSGRRLVPRYELREMEAAAPARLSEEEVVQQFIDEFDAQETGD
jgi:DNA polymerase-3 subunit gamma/tau